MNRHKAIQNLGTFMVPEHALTYLVNGDLDVLSEEETADCDRWLEQFKHNNIWFDVDVMQWADFEEDPAFGLPCDCLPVTVMGTFKGATS